MRWSIKVGFSWVAMLIVACGDATSSQTPPAAAAGDAAGGDADQPATYGGMSSDAGGQSGGAQSPTEGGASGSSGQCDCDDGVACTLDDCDEAGQCTHVAQHFACKPGAYCATDRGCTVGAACANDTDCARPDACAAVTCDASQRRCVYSFLDGDGDGDAAFSCGGNDCNDDDPDVNVSAKELCNGIDDDCDGVVDPAQSSGCAEGRSCEAGACRCSAGKTSCGGEAGVCVDLERDLDNCGKCGAVCPSSATCVGGSCQCESSQSICGGTCVDLKTSSTHCGGCNKACGGSSVCDNGSCDCPENTTNCGSLNPYCVDLTSDSTACGDCNTSCPWTSSCQKGNCDASIEWARFYGDTSLGHSFLHNVSLAVDTKQNIFVSASLESGHNYRELPSPNTPLWSTRDAILKFDTKGNLLWSKPSNNWIQQIVSAGDDVWALSSDPLASINIAGHVCTRAGGAKVVTCMVKLSGVDGSILDFQQVDHADGMLSPPRIYADASGKAWLMENASELSVAATSYARPSAAYTAYVLPQGGEPLWLTTLSDFHRDGSDFIFQQTMAAGTTFDFGGGAIKADSNSSALVRVSSDLKYKSAVLVPAQGSLVLSQGGFLFVGQSGKPYLQRYAQDGSFVQSNGASPPFFASRRLVGGGRLHVTGETGSNGAEYEGRYFVGSFAGVVASFDETTLKLTNALTLDPELSSNSTSTGIYGAQLVDNGSAVVLAVLFSGGVNLGGSNHEFSSASGGFALVKVKLPSH